MAWRLARVPFDTLEEGTSFGPFPYRVPRRQSDHLRGQVGEATPGDSAPPGVHCVLFLQGFCDAMGGIPPGGILAREKLEIHAAMPAECDVSVGVSIERKIAEPGRRPRAVIAFDVANEGRCVARGEMEIVWAPDGEPEKR